MKHTTKQIRPDGPAIDCLFETGQRAEEDILKTGILVCVPLPTFRDPTSQSKMSGLEILPHPTCEVKGSGDCECPHPISHMASGKWDSNENSHFLNILPRRGSKRNQSGHHITTNHQSVGQRPELHLYEVLHQNANCLMFLF